MQHITNTSTLNQMKWNKRIKKLHKLRKREQDKNSKGKITRIDAPSNDYKLGVTEHRATKDDSLIKSIIKRIYSLFTTTCVRCYISSRTCEMTRRHSDLSKAPDRASPERSSLKNFPYLPASRNSSQRSFRRMEDRTGRKVRRRNRAREPKSCQKSIRKNEGRFPSYRNIKETTNAAFTLRAICALFIATAFLGSVTCHTCDTHTYTHARVDLTLATWRAWLPLKRSDAIMWGKPIACLRWPL